MLQAELSRAQQTTSVEELSPSKTEGDMVLLLPIETSSYDAAPLESLARIWFPEYLPSYLDEDTPSEEEFPGESAAALFLFSVQQLIQRERASLGIWKAVFETRDPPTVIRAGSNSDRFKDRRWLQIGRTLELFRSFEDGWDGHGASAPNQASIAVAQILLHNLELNTTPPRIMIDAEGDVVLTWDHDEGSIFLTVEPSRLHLLVKAGEAVESEEIKYEGPIPKTVLSRLPRTA